MLVTLRQHYLKTGDLDTFKACSLYLNMSPGPSARRSWLALVCLVLASSLLLLVLFAASSVQLFLCVGGWDAEVRGCGNGVAA